MHLPAHRCPCATTRLKSGHLPSGLRTLDLAPFQKQAEPGKGQEVAQDLVFRPWAISLSLLLDLSLSWEGPGVSPEPRMRDKVKPVFLDMSAWFLIPGQPDSGCCGALLPPPLPSPLACQLIIRC